MKIEVDTHTHTILSGHAFSTLSENIEAAKDKGLKGIVMTEHGPNMPGGAPHFLIGTYGVIPEYIEGIRIYRGCEADILNETGELDIPDRYLEKADFVLASLHAECVRPKSKEENTQSMINALKNPNVDAIAHPGNPVFEVDIEKVVKCAGEFNKCLEINAHSFVFRKGSKPVCEEFARLCILNKIKICVSSDAHIKYRIGEFAEAIECLEKLNFPMELIMNRTVKSFEEHLGLEHLYER